ncbi:MAG: GtrA family protein [Thermodesulfovibrionales bacterium]|jgi:putative flippase GtrA
MTWCSKANFSPMAFWGNLWQKRFLRFLFIGGINTLLSYTIYALGLFFGLNYTIAYLLALIIGIFFSFKTLGKFVFNNSDYRLFCRFVLFWALIYGFNIMCIGIIIIYFGLNAYAAGALMIAPNAILSYWLQKRFIFDR